jgi:predicted nuclease with TOPRIM domain
MTDQEKIDALNQKIDSVEKNIKSLLDEKIKSISDDCDDLYKQITELRNTVQEIYGEIAESNRFQSGQLLKMSERLENLAKEISEATNEKGEDGKKDGVDLTNLGLKQMIAVFSAIAVGVLIVVGGVALTLFKVADILKGLLP